MWTRDNLDVLRGLNSESIDLVYADPPFNSNKNYEAPIGSKAAGAAFKDTWTLSDVDLAWPGETAEREPCVYAAIEPAGIVHGKSMRSYLTMMAVRLLELRRRPEPFAKRRGVDPADAVLLQHLGQRHLANPLARARRRQAPPQVERPRRRDVAVNRIEKLRGVAPELVSHSGRGANTSRVRSSLRRDHSRSSTIVGSIDSAAANSAGRFAAPKRVPVRPGGRPSRPPAKGDHGSGRVASD